MKIIEKENLTSELREAISSIEVVEGVGKESKKPYTAIKATGKNDKSLLFFLKTEDLLRLGLVINDEGGN